MILDELIKTNNRWAQDAQPQVVEATVSALGGSDTSYAIQFKNGAKATNIDGPSGLLVGNAVVVISYPGKAKKYAILQKTSGGSEQEITTVQV
jgi:hypothetical protein